MKILSKFVVVVSLTFFAVGCNSGGGGGADSTTSQQPTDTSAYRIEISSPSKTLTNTSSSYEVKLIGFNSMSLQASDLEIIKTGDVSVNTLILSKGNNTYEVRVSPQSGEGTVKIKILGDRFVKPDGSKISDIESSLFNGDKKRPTFATGSRSTNDSAKEIHYPFICDSGKTDLRTKNLSDIQVQHTGNLNLTASYGQTSVILKVNSGDGSLTNVSLPNTICVDLAGNTLSNTSGRLNHPAPVAQVFSKYTIESIDTGNYGTCAKLSNGKVKCWGANFLGQLGLGHKDDIGDQASEMENNLDYISLGTSKTVSEFKLGGSYQCAKLSSNEFKCWGSNGAGVLGKGNTNALGDEAGEMGDSLAGLNFGVGRTVSKFALGGSHACGILDNNSLVCWGNNSFGQLGLGHTNNIGDNSSEMGSNLVNVNLGAGKTAKEVYAGEYNSCAILNDDSLKCWGRNNYGQLGLGDTNDRGDGTGEMGDNLVGVNLGAGRTIRSVAISTESICALLDDNSVKCWGRNNYGQLGIEDSITRGDNAGEMGATLNAINFGVGVSAHQIVAGTHSFCALLSNNSITCWGQNSDGSLGLGFSAPWHGEANGDMGANLKTVNTGLSGTIIQISRGHFNSCALNTLGDLKCWGKNSSGELGQERALPSSVGSSTSHMSTALPFTKVSNFEVK